VTGGMARLAPALTLSLGLAFSNVALAQDPPPGNDFMMQMCSGFLKQPGVEIAADGQRLCDCLIREVKAKLSTPEMQAYDRATLGSQPMPEALQAKITGIAVQCLGEAR